MLGIIDASPSHPLVTDARRVLFRARMHTLIISPDTLAPAYDMPLRALLILRPEGFPHIADLCARARAQFPALPLALFLRKTNTEGNAFVYRRLADFVYDDNVTTERLISELFAAHEARGGARDNRIAGGLVMERDREFASIFGLPIPYTESEWMLLRYLLLISPRTATAEELAAIALRPTGAPAPHTAVSHISNINRKTEDALSGYRPIENTGAGGYRLHIR